MADDARSITMYYLSSEAMIRAACVFDDRGRSFIIPTPYSPDLRRGSSQLFPQPTNPLHPAVCHCDSTVLYCTGTHCTEYEGTEHQRRCQWATTMTLHFTPSHLPSLRPPSRRHRYTSFVHAVPSSPLPSPPFLLARPDPPPANSIPLQLPPGRAFVSVPSFHRSS